MFTSTPSLQKKPLPDSMTATLRISRERFSQEKISVILESITGCFFLLNQDWQFQQVNFHCEDYLPCPRQELFQKTLWEVFPHWIQTECDSQLHQVLSEKTTAHFEFFDTKKSKWYEIYASPSLQGLSIHFHDITLQKGIDLQRDTEYLITQILAIAPSISKAIPKILQAIAENLGWEIGLFWKMDDSLHKIRCTHPWKSPSLEAFEFIEKSQQFIFDVGIELPGQVWDSGEPRWIANLYGTSHFLRAPYALKAGLSSGFIFPIRLGEEVLGVMEFFSLQTKALDRNLLQMFDAIGSQIGQFIERKEAEEKLRLAYEEMEQRVQKRTLQLIQSNQVLQEEIMERRRVEKEVLEISQKEQRKFGSQLHDGFCQDLTGILMLMKALFKKMEKKNQPESFELKKMMEILNQSIDQARDMAHGLYPVKLEGTSLMQSLRELASQTQKLFNISCRFDCPEPILIDDNNIATHLYRIAQEGINNAVKHGKAKEIEISLTQNDGETTLAVIDNGIGLTEDPKNSKGIGLHIMKYRARMMEASLQLEPNSSQGVILKCRLKAPILENHEPR
jgi:signal transduction histidine kinase